VGAVDGNGDEEEGRGGRRDGRSRERERAGDSGQRVGRGRQRERHGRVAAYTLYSEEWSIGCSERASRSGVAAVSSCSYLKKHVETGGPGGSLWSGP
jgi:hypothetical protein